jgi:hypothetical protein
LLARQVLVDYQSVIPWSDTEVKLASRKCVVHAEKCPCIGLSLRTPEEVADFLLEQGYPYMRCTDEEAEQYACYIDLPSGLGKAREEQVRQRSSLVQQIEQLDAPFLRFGCWPDGQHAALAISGDIDSVTIQDFFLRVLEVSKHT